MRLKRAANCMPRKCAEGILDEGFAGVAQDAVLQVPHTAVEIEKFPGVRIQHQGVDRESR